MNITINEIREICAKLKETYCSDFQLSDNIFFEIKDLPFRVYAETKYSEKTSIIYISKNLIGNLNSENTTDKEFNFYKMVFWHSLHHELCHIEINNNAKIFKNIIDEYLSGNKNLLWEHLLSWFLSEYIACYLSYKTFDKTIGEDYIKTYSNFGEKYYTIDDIMQLVKCSAYLLGETSSDNIILTYRNKVFNSIKNSTMLESLVRLDKIGKIFAKNYKNISMIDIDKHKTEFINIYSNLINSKEDIAKH